MSVTTKSIMNNLDPFSVRDSSFNSDGQRVYWAATWMQSNTPNGRYTITRVSPSHWTVRHHQVISGGRQEVRRILGVFRTKAAAMKVADDDSHELEDNFLKHLLSSPAVSSAVVA